jgi:hypothetical protein
MMVFSRTEMNNDRVANSNTDMMNNEAIILVDRLLIRAKEILSQEKLLLLKMSEYLTSNSLIDSKKAEEFYRAYGYVKDLEFLDQKNYYPYKKIMEEELRKITLSNEGLPEKS